MASKSKRSALRHRQRLMGQVYYDGVYVTRETFGQFFEGWLRSRNPYVARGTWEGYEIHGRKRLIPAFGKHRLTAITTFEIRDWLLELFEVAISLQKTLYNTLSVLVAALNGACSIG